MGPVGAILGSLGAILGPFGVILEPLGAILAPSWGHLGASAWSLLGPSCCFEFEDFSFEFEDWAAGASNSIALHRTLASATSGVSFARRRQRPARRRIRRANGPRRVRQPVINNNFHLPPSQGEVYLPLYPPPQGRFGTQSTRIKLPNKPSYPSLSLPTFDPCFDIASKVQKCRILMTVITFWGSQVSNLRGSGGPFGGPSGPQMGDDL